MDLDDSIGFSPIWGHDPGQQAANQANTFLAPRKFVATKLRIRLLEPFTAGSRKFTFTRNLGQPNAAATKLSCTVTAPSRTCKSNARAKYRENDIVSAQVESSLDAAGGINAAFGWVAITP